MAAQHKKNANPLGHSPTMTDKWMFSLPLLLPSSLKITMNHRDMSLKKVYLMWVTSLNSSLNHLLLTQPKCSSRFHFNFSGCLVTCSTFFKLQSSRFYSPSSWYFCTATPFWATQPLQLVSHDLPDQIGEVMVTLKTTTILGGNFDLDVFLAKCLLVGPARIHQSTLSRGIFCLLQYLQLHGKKENHEHTRHNICQRTSTSCTTKTLHSLSSFTCFIKDWGLLGIPCHSMNPWEWKFNFCSCASNSLIIYPFPLVFILDPKSHQVDVRVVVHPTHNL